MSNKRRRDTTGDEWSQWTIRSGETMIVVYDRPGRNDWYMSCDSLGLSGHRLEADDVESAKREAVDVAIDVTRVLYRDLRKMERMTIMFGDRGRQ